jgi:hypothetical protein
MQKKLVEKEQSLPKFARQPVNLIEALDKQLRALAGGV